MRRQGVDRIVRAATAIDGNVRCLPTADFGVRAFDLVEFARVIERRGRSPRPAHYVHVFGRAPVARRVVRVVAVPSLVRVTAASDDVHGETPARELVERREFSRGQCRRHETRPMREQEFECRRRSRRMSRDQKPVRRMGIVADQHAIEAAALVQARGFRNHRRIERRAIGRNDFRGDPRRHPTDHLNRHCVAPASPGRKPDSVVSEL